MVKKKKEDKKSKPSSKKSNKNNVDVDIEKYSISELLEKNNFKALDAVGFLNFYGLTESFKKEMDANKCINKFSQGEFDDMYKRYIEREI